MRREDFERALLPCEECGAALRLAQIALVNEDNEERVGGYVVGFTRGQYAARVTMTAECSSGQHAFRVYATLGHDDKLRIDRVCALRRLPPILPRAEAELLEAVLDGWDLLVWNGDTEQPDEEAARKRIEAAVEFVRMLRPKPPRVVSSFVENGVNIKEGQMLALGVSGGVVPASTRTPLGIAAEDLPGGSVVEIDATRGRAKLAKDLADFYRPMAEDAIGAPETIPAETVVTQEMLKDFALRKLAEAGFVVPKDLPVGVEVQSDRDPGQPLDRLPVCECGGELWVFDGPRAPLPDDQVYCRCKSCGREVRVRVHQEFKP